MKKIFSLIIGSGILLACSNNIGLTKPQNAQQSQSKQDGVFQSLQLTFDEAKIRFADGSLRSQIKACELIARSKERLAAFRDSEKLPLFGEDIKQKLDQSFIRFSCGQQVDEGLVQKPKEELQTEIEKRFADAQAALEKMGDERRTMACKGLQRALTVISALQIKEGNRAIQEKAQDQITKLIQSYGCANAVEVPSGEQAPAELPPVTDKVDPATVQNDLTKALEQIAAGRVSEACSLLGAALERNGTPNETTKQVVEQITAMHAEKCPAK